MPRPAARMTANGGAATGELCWEVKRGNLAGVWRQFQPASRLWVKFRIAGGDACRPWKSLAFPPVGKVDGLSRVSHNRLGQG